MSFVVTGTGCISALGGNVEKCLARLYAGVVQPPSTASLDPDLENPPPVFAVTDPVPEENQRRTRTAALGLHAVAEAVEAAWGRGADIKVASNRIGVCFGTTVGCTFNEEKFYRAYHSGQDPGPEAIRRYLNNDLAKVVAEAVGATGPVMVIANACAAGSDAIGMGMAWLAADLCDLVIAGGADELARFAYLGFASLKNCASGRCQPFDRDRQGLNLGEAGAALVLEREADARRRSAPILAQVAGYGSAADAHHPTAPHPDGRGLRQALTVALEMAGLGPSEIGFVNAHGTGTRENDRIEGRVLNDTLGEEVPVFSTKGCTGHTLGAAGALEAVLTVHNLLDGKIPASAGFVTADPECRTIPTTAVQESEFRSALSTSLAFGGSNSAVVFRGLRGGPDNG